MEGEEGGMHFSFVSFPLLTFFFPLFMRMWGEGDREAPLGRQWDPWVAAGVARRGWEWGKYVKNSTSSCLRAEAG